MNALWDWSCTAPLNRLPCYGALETILTLLLLFCEISDRHFQPYFATATRLRFDRRATPVQLPCDRATSVRGVDARPSVGLQSRHRCKKPLH